MKYRLSTWVAGILTFALVGTWLGLVTQVTPAWPSMTVAGTVLGVVAVVAFLRAMGRRPRPYSHTAGRGS